MALALADLRFKSTPLSSDHWRENLAGADTSDSELVKWTIRGGLINGLRIDERGANLNDYIRTIQRRVRSA